jgi:hypothetical protein
MCLVVTATHFRKETPPPNGREYKRGLLLLDGLILDDLLRLQICISDQHIPDKDKQYARDVFPKILAYATAHDIAAAYEPGHEYKMLPNDMILPKEMAIRDVFDKIAKHVSGPPEKLLR